MDKLEHMIGSYGPADKPYTSRFHSEESPSGMLARSGTYNVRSRVVDDDKEVYAGMSRVTGLVVHHLKYVNP